jgi:hypothetical protein
VSIVLLNLLTGLAVSDTEQIKRDAERLSVESRVRMISKLETFIDRAPKWFKIHFKMNEEMFIIYPNRHNKIGSAAVQSLLSIISEKTQPEDGDKLTALKKDWRMFKEKLYELQILQEKLQINFESILD